SADHFRGCFAGAICLPPSVMWKEKYKGAGNHPAPDDPGLQRLVAFLLRSRAPDRIRQRMITSLAGGTTTAAAGGTSLMMILPAIFAAISTEPGPPRARQCISTRLMSRCTGSM